MVIIECSEERAESLGLSSESFLVHEIATLQFHEQLIPVKIDGLTYYKKEVGPPERVDVIYESALHVTEEMIYTNLIVYHYVTERSFYVKEFDTLEELIGFLFDWQPCCDELDVFDGDSLLILEI